MMGWTSCVRSGSYPKTAPSESLESGLGQARALRRALVTRTNERLTFAAPRLHLRGSTLREGSMSLRCWNGHLTFLGRPAVTRMHARLVLFTVFRHLRGLV